MWNIEGKTVLITGATSGIGKETALELARRGARIVMISRSEERGQAAIDEITQGSGNAQVEMLLADLASQAQIRQAAQEFRTRYDALHVLINNAALVTRKRSVTEDGIEMQVAVNHLAPFLLTSLLLDMLKGSAPARVVNVSSAAHYGASINFQDINSKKVYRPFRVYSMTKLMNVLFTNELARRLGGTGVTANSLHPGTISTNLGREAPFLNWIIGFFFKSPEEGAQTSIKLAASPEVSDISGEYFNDDGEIARQSAEAQNEANAKRLWALSEQLTGLAEPEPA